VEVGHLDTEPAASTAEVTDDTNTESGGAVAETDGASFYDEPTDPVDGEEGEDYSEDADEEGSEPEEAIAAPVSLKAEEKERFAQLPVEAQRMMAEVLTRRDSEVQKGLEGARTAQRDAERTAADTVAQTQRDYADRFERFTQAFAPPEPQRQQYPNDMAYLVAVENHRREMAGFRQLVEQVNGIKGEADSHFSAREQEWRQDQVKQLMSVPEFADESSRASFIQGIEDFAVNDLGYGKDEIAQAGAKDIIGLKKAMGWKAKAEKYDAYVARRNERPRQAGKFAKPAPAGGRAPMGRQGVNTDVASILYPDD
jgi:hypothetical protein